MDEGGKCCLLLVLVLVVFSLGTLFWGTLFYYGWNVGGAYFNPSIKPVSFSIACLFGFIICCILTALRNASATKKD